MEGLGISVPRSALAWVDEQIDRLWQLRGPAPGLAAVLRYLGAESAHQVIRRLVEDADWRQDPWSVVERALDPTQPLGQGTSGSSAPVRRRHVARP